MPFTPVDHHQFSDNMNVVARVVNGDVDVNGKLLDHFTPDDNQATLNLSHLIDGVYFIEARTLNGSRAIKQILKQ
ncbi:MAG: T9SS type A sorting domain-containing protein [Muribaculaceae bacterium]|nr:T9SS type A sorting domain-containing protein [Muribaculaceae bacterium]